MGPYKKYQCRYFHSDGRSKIPNCNQGSSCRFLHPDDEGWPGLKPKPQERRINSLDSLSQDKDRLPPKPYILNSPPHRSEPRSAPLVSQDDLFLRRKIADNEKIYEASSHSRMSLGYSDGRDYHNRGRDSKRNKVGRSRDNSTNSSRPYDTVSYLGVKRPASSNRSASIYYQKARIRKNMHMGDPSNSPDDPTRTLRSCLHPAERPSDYHSVNSLIISTAAMDTSSAFASGAPSAAIFPGRTSPAEKRVQQVIALFRNLSRLSSQAALDAEAQAREDKKLKAYTELSSTLAKVSSTAAAAVMPTLADVLLRHAHGTQRAEDNLNAISGIWSEAFDFFVTEVSHAVDAKLEEALQKIREEVELMHNSVRLHTSTPAPRRQRNDIFPSEHLASRSRDGSRDQTSDLGYAKDTDTDGRRDSKREQKRRRFSSVSPTPDRTRQDAEQSTVKLESSMQNILSQMKTKIDEQAQSLHKLTKENNELKASLNQRPSITSCISSSVTTGSRQLILRQEQTELDFTT